MTIALFSWLGSASVLSRSPDFPLFLLMFYAEKWPPSSVIVLHLMTHSTAASSYYPNVKVWTPLLEGLKKVFICTPLSAGNKKNWLMENAKLLKRFCADEPNPRHCCKKPIQDKGRQLQILMVSLTSWIPNCPFGLHLYSPPRPYWGVC